MNKISLKELLGEEEETLVQSPNPQTDEAIEPQVPSVKRFSASDLLGPEVQTQGVEQGEPLGSKGAKTFSLKDLSAPAPGTTNANPLNPDVFKLTEEYGRGLTKQDFLSDPRLMTVVRESLSGRYKPATLTGVAAATATGLAGGDVGGLSGRDYQAMDDEEVFEIWQNYQRSFAGGQTVTTANEVVYGMGADEDTRAKLGAGYLLFGSMDNAITGEGSWAEMGDAIFDYTKAALWDPSTIASFGIGKALGHAGTKVAAATARSTMIASYQAALNRGLQGPVAKAAVGAALKGAQYAIPDAAIAMGTDVAYQMQLIDTGAQEEYSRFQTALSAAGGMVIPAAMAVSAGIGTARGLRNYLDGTRLDPSVLNVSGKEALEKNQEFLNTEQVLSHIDSQFGKIEGTTKDWLEWSATRDAAKKTVANLGELEKNMANQSAFYKYLWLGDPETNQGGLYGALKDAGFRVTPAMKDEFGVAGSFGQALKFLSDAQAAKAITAFENSSGIPLGITKTAEGLSSHFINNSSLAGQANWLPSHLSRLENISGKKKPTPEDTQDLLEAAGGKLSPDADDPRRAQFALSVYKRLLTSSLSTTGTNIKGFGLSTLYNTASDFAIGAINLGQSAYYKLLKGDEEKAVQFMNRAYGSALGAARRGVSVLTPNMEMDFAESVLNANPEFYQKLFRDIAADGGVREAFEEFNLKGAVWKGADEITKGAQTLTLVRLQDEISKTWAFGNNVDQAIMREYGVLGSEFFKRPDAALEMSSDRFKLNVLEKATFRTLKETASINWQTLPSRGGASMRGMAKAISAVSNNSAMGYVLPFGNFMNTNLAVIGDLTGVNAVRFLTRKAFGEDLDFVTEEGAEALGKAVVGWSAIAMSYHGVGEVLGAKEKVEQGYTFNQKVKSDGSIEDIQYDGFAAGIDAIAQALAHGLDGRPLSALSDITDPKEVEEFLARIPKDLWMQIGVQLGGQIVRDIDDLNRSVLTASSALTNGDLQEIGQIVSAFPARVFQGVTRPLEPIDQVYGLFTDKNMTPDLRQGPGKLYEALRYIDNLTGISEELPRRATATQGTLRSVDIGKQMFGVRGLNEPVLYERMLNAAGVSPWNAVSFRVPPEVKNVMDTMAAPLLEVYATRYLKANPDYFSLPQEQKEAVISQIGELVNRDVINNMKGGAVPKSLDLFRVLSGKNKGQVAKILDFMKEDDLESILKREDAYETLKKVQFLFDNFDDIFQQPLNLD